MEADQTALPRRRAEIVPAPHRKDIFLKKWKEIKLFEVEQTFKIWERLDMFAISLLGFALDDKNFNIVSFAAWHSV